MSEPTLRAGQKSSYMFRRKQGWEIHTPYLRNHNASVFPPLLDRLRFTKHFHRPRLIHTLRKYEVEFPSATSKVKIFLLQENISGTRGLPGLLMASLLEGSTAPDREVLETPVGRRPLKARAPSFLKTHKGALFPDMGLKWWLQPSVAQIPSDPGLVPESLCDVCTLCDCYPLAFLCGDEQKLLFLYLDSSFLLRSLPSTSQ